MHRLGRQEYGRGCHRHRRRTGRAGRRHRADRRRQRVILLDQERGAVARRPGLLVLRRPLLRRLPRAAAAAHPRQPRPRPAGLDGLGRLRPRRGPLAAPVGRGLCRLRGRREARLAARQGRALVSHRRLGRARRLPRHRARQLGAALPRHLGHRARHRRAVRATRARGARSGAWSRCASATASTASPRRRAWSTACAATSWRRARSSAARRARAPWPATSS